MENQEDKYPGQERREYPRIKGITATYAPIGKEGLEAVGFVRNMSAKGVNLNVIQKIEDSTVLSLRMNLPGSSIPIEFKGRVIWSQEIDLDLRSEILGYELGIEFVEISDDNRHKITRYVADCLEKNHP